jgi:hypothetical protein
MISFVFISMKSIVEIIKEEVQDFNNLNENFYKWFGDSKVVDKRGQPLRVYHGTQKDFQEFKSDTGLMYFSKTPRYASEFATNPHIKSTVDDPQRSVMPVYLSIQKPLDLLKFKNELISHYEFAGELKNQGVEINFNELHDTPWGITLGMGDDVRAWQWIRFNAKYLIPIFKSKGFDGIFMYENADTGDKQIQDIAYVIFNNTQVKSATGNNGEYDKSNPDITKESLSEDYKGSHEAPGPNGDDAPMYDVTKEFGEDIYSSNAVRMFGGYGPYDNYSVALIQRAKNKPNMQIRIYRAIPKIITNQEKINDYEKRLKYVLKTGRLPRDVDNFRNSSEYYDWLSSEVERLKTLPSDEKTKINNGDWVTINPAYAKIHGQGNLNNKFRVLSKTVSAKQLYTDGNSIHEWGYAENGPSGLNEEIQKLNQNFWQWFGNSKVLKNGKPLIMHHGGSFSASKPSGVGISKPFNEFKGVGWFTSSKADARYYAKQSGGYNLTSVYLKIENPLYSGKQEDGSYIETNDAVLLARRSNGKYDGVIDVENSNILDAIVWNSNQIKSATDNDGNFNDDPDVLKEVNVSNKKLYYHGRSKSRPYTGKYIFITDNLGYASGYSDENLLYTFTIPFSQDKIFSIRNPRHLELLRKYTDQQTVEAILRDSGPQSEIDWATLSYISTDDYEDAVDLFEHLRFYGVRLKERQGIDSIYIFNEDTLDYKGTINTSKPEYKQQIGKFYKDFTKGKNFLEGVGDRYAEKLGVSDDSMNTRVFKNPRILDNVSPDVRAIGDEQGNLYVSQQDDMTHSEMAEEMGLDDYKYYYRDKFVSLFRINNTNSFGLNTLTFDYMNLDHISREKVLEILSKIRQNNPQYKFYVRLYDPENSDEDNNLLEQTSESLADRYAERQFNISDPNKEQDVQAKGALQKDLEKPYGYAGNMAYNGRDVSNARIAVYKNPLSLENFDANVRAIGCISGNLYVAQKNGMLMHGQMGEYINLDSSGVIYSGKYLLLNRDELTNDFVLSDTSEEDYPKYWEHFNNIIKNIETKNPRYKINASIDHVDDDDL